MARPTMIDVLFGENSYADYQNLDYTKVIRRKTLPHNKLPNLNTLILSKDTF